ncbi:MAG TPA: sigma-70 family RNA polymerase sigma factor [Fimbriiglobus sp.]|nr:sigma-70 family RNA polymerase sigma factor [Fimbriiglobus sp.]
MTDFKHPALRELTDQQVRFAPPVRRQEQVARAERLLGEIDPDRVYPYQFVCFRLTDYRSDALPDLLVPGADLKHDLALFVKRVERSLPPLPVELAAEPMLTLDEVSRQFNVSTKTVSRWRMQGLVARRVIRDGRKQLGFPKSTVAGFAAAHREQVERGARFSHLTETEKDEIILTARRLAALGGCLTEVSRAIADKLGRSAEAVRYTIKNFDRDHPERAVFPTLTGPLDAASKTRIYTAYQEGDSVQLIAKRFGRTPSSMYRVINEVRAERLVREPISYIYNAEFDDPAKVADILGPMPNEEDFFGKVRTMRPPKDVEAHMAYLYERPLLSREQEAHLFRKMNYLKHVLGRLQERIGDAPVRVPDLERIEDLQTQIKTVRDLLIECNQRLVHNLATKHLNPGQNLDELKSDANVSIMRAVEKFDYGRGFKFSTYATWAIMKNFARSIPDENTRRSRYLTGADELFDGKADVRTDEQEVLTAASQARDRVNRLLDYLDPRTQEVIRMRTGLDGREEMTLEQIGQHFGITKERVRQINVRGMKQLREKAAQENVDLP